MPAPHQKNKLHPQDQKNLMFFAISFGIIYLLFDAFLLRPHMERMDSYHKQTVTKQAAIDSGVAPPEFLPRDEILPSDARVEISHESLVGSIRLKGGRIDDISLQNYFETLEKEERVAVMSPEKTAFPRYAEFGWLDSNGQSPNVPNDETPWRVKSKIGDILTLYWQNGQGLVFERDIEVVDDFLIKVTQRVINRTQIQQTLFPYALITEHGMPTKLMHRWIIHEGPIGFIADRLEERDYSDMTSQPIEGLEAAKGWIGFTEQYWLTAILPEQDTDKTFRYAYKQPQNPGDTKGIFQVDVMSGGKVIAPNSATEHVTHVFAGAKEFNALKKYEQDLNITNFDSAIDWGWFWFLTKPFFTVLLMINSVTGYFAVTMLAFALLLRILIFPMANTSYRSFAKLRVITPRIMEIKENYAEDKVGMQREMMKLYKTEKVNPAAGCLPILIQIPIFFSLFKVLNVAIEMRHAPGFFWIDDLSAPDPTSLFNLFGALPYDVPSLLVIGAWPCLMVVTLLFQKSMNPPPTDPVVRDMFRIMPYFMGFIMAGFAAGLVIYWTFTNLLSCIQQYVIMRMMGVEVKFFQGWFGREVQQSNPDVSKLGFSPEAVKEHEERLKKAKEKKEGKDDDDAEKAENDGGDGDDETPKDISPPKPKKKKKKK